ncbi:MAG: SRPBCC family protein [Acidimicrobiaceae bacterium]
MDLVASVEVPVSVEKLFDYVADLANYSSWLEFVHKVELVGESVETDATWLVELRAKLGVLARSKRLRMTRTLCEHPRQVVFERRDQDRHHGSQQKTQMRQMLVKATDHVLAACRRDHQFDQTAVSTAWLEFLAGQLSRFRSRPRLRRAKLLKFRHGAPTQFHE